MKTKKSRIFNGPAGAEAPALDEGIKNAIDGLQNRISAKVDSVTADVKNLTDKHDATDGKLAELEQSIANIQLVHNEDLDPMGGYKNHAEFLVDVKNAANGTVPDRLKKFAAVGTDEQATFSNPDGGFLLPEGIMEGIMETDPFAIQADTGLSTRRIPMQQQIVNINARVDKNHSSSVTGGFRVYRNGEAQQASSSKGTFEQIKLSAEGLMGLAYGTNELLSRSPISFAALISAGFETEYRSKLNNERLRGTGAGEYMGILNSPALITVAKEGSQTADTIVGANLQKMRARIWGYNQAVWMVNQDCYTSLSTAHISLSNDDVPLFVAGNGVDVPDTILGRPVVYDENMSTLGDVGDIVLVNWMEYLEGFLGGVEQSSSIHVRFETNETAFKFTAYCDGQPWWRTALTPKQSSTTLSPFVTLAERA